MSWSMSGTITPATTLARRCSSSSRCSIIGSGCIRRSAMSARCSSKPTTLSPFEGVYGIGGSSGRPAADVARELGIPRNRLYKWGQQLEHHGEAAFPGSGRQAGAEAEVTRLRREVARLKEERDILKKAAAYFARESG